jgi:hypothetical protein
VHIDKVHSVTTIDRVAEDLEEDVELLHELSLGMDTEDGVIWPKEPRAARSWPLPMTASKRYSEPQRLQRLEDRARDTRCGLRRQ